MVKGKLSSLIGKFLDEIRSRAQAGKSSFQLYDSQCKSKLPWCQLWKLNRALNLYDYATGNKSCGGSEGTLRHIGTLVKRVFVGFK